MTIKDKKKIEGLVLFNGWRTVVFSEKIPMVGVTKIKFRILKLQSGI